MYGALPDKNSRRRTILHQDDLDQLQALYSDFVDVNPLWQRFCSIATIDAITQYTFRGAYYTYAFQGDLYIKMKNGLVEDSYPRAVVDDWQGISQVPDAIYNPSGFVSAVDSAATVEPTLHVVTRQSALHYQADSHSRTPLPVPESMSVEDSRRSAAVFVINNDGNKREYHISGESDSNLTCCGRLFMAMTSRVRCCGRNLWYLYGFVVGQEYSYSGALWWRSLNELFPGLRSTISAASEIGQNEVYVFSEQQFFVYDVTAYDTLTLKVRYRY